MWSLYRTVGNWVDVRHALQLNESLWSVWRCTYASCFALWGVYHVVHVGVPPCRPHCGVVLGEGPDPGGDVLVSPRWAAAWYCPLSQTWAPQLPCTGPSWEWRANASWRSGDRHLPVLQWWTGCHLLHEIGFMNVCFMNTYICILTY